MFGNWPKLTLARIGGFPIRLDATFLIVPLLFANWVTSQPGADIWYTVAAIVVGIFLSVLLHELGHALTARAAGVGVQEVVIGGFFGYARLMPQRVKRLTAIGIVLAGPMANLALFAVLWALLSFPSFDQTRAIAVIGYSSIPFPVWLVKAVGVLAIVNLAMFVFNLFPAYPLDGGRITDLILQRFVGPQTGLWISALLGIGIGLFVAVFGARFGFLMMLIGAFIAIVNLSRLRRARQSPHHTDGRTLRQNRRTGG